MSDCYKDPRWQKKRLLILERDNWRCQACFDSESTLHVHHILYDGDPWNVEDLLLQTLCESCHEKLGPHPKAGVYWVRSAEDGTELARPHVAVHWCPQCGSQEFRERSNARWYTCARCSWNTGCYESFLFSSGITVISLQRAGKAKQYSLEWLKGMMTRVRKSNPSEIDLFDVLFPESSCRDLFLELDQAIKEAKLALQDNCATEEEIVSAITRSVYARSRLRSSLLPEGEKVA